MAPTVRLKKSLNEGRTFGKRKNSKSESSGDGRDKFRSSPRRNVEGEGRGDDRPRFRSNSRGNGGGEGRGDDRPRFRSNSRGYGVGEGRGYDRPRFRSNSRSYGEGEERGYLSTEKKFVRRGGDSGSKGFGRRPRYGERRDFGGDDFGGTRELRGERTGGRKGRVQIPQRSELIDELRSRGRKLGWKRRVERMNAGETMSPKPREMRGDRRMNRVEDGEDDSGGTRVMRGSRERGGRQGEVNDEVRPRGRKLGRGRNDENGEDMDGGVDSVEASSDRHRLKWKKMDKNVKNRDESDFVEDLTGHRGGKDGNYRDKGKKMNKGDFVEELLDYNVKGDNESDQVAEKKPVRRPTRVLDKTGKKIRVVQKRSDDSSKETHIPAKKKKRVIKLDPYDTSNKRLDDDTAPSSEKSDENDTEISKNAQFRAIQPSPSILSFVEDNLLGRRRLNELKNAGYNIKLSAPLDNVPFSTSLERERIEENAFRNKLEFFAAAKISSSFPPPTLPEIAFAGRSNVGKSSLLNALTRQWGVVRVSDKPGLTQTINFFNLASKLCLVDLPGYGFAYAKDEAKDAWEELVKEYVSTRVGLERVCVLVDTKWGMKARDHELIDLMEKSTTPYQIVLTKTDLVFPIDVARRAMQIQENLKRNKSIINPVMMVSSKSGAGIRNLRTVLSKITRFVKP